ncbi:MAG: Uma2 family endonuclease [Acidobacteriota bacterium]
MASVRKPESLYTEDEYLALERASQERREYLDGQIYLMAGESPAHGTICTNLTAEIAYQLKGQRCQVWSKDTKVRSGPIPKSRYSAQGLYSFPDLVVACGEAQYLDEHRDVLVNPKVIIEVLSPSTEAFDRGEKFARYREHLDSLTDYVVVAQSMPLVEHFSRQSNGEWVIAAKATELSGSVVLSSIDCTLRLSEVYDRIAFPAPGDEDPAPRDTKEIS